jgi:hypothetical protein
LEVLSLEYPPMTVIDLAAAMLGDAAKEAVP